MNEEPAQVLVTGATGMVGSAIVSRLLEDGYRVRALTRSAQNARSEHTRFEAIRADVRDTEAMRRAAADCQGVVHCAARKNDERDSYAVNVLGTQNLVMAAARARAAFFIHVSTQSTKLDVRGRYGETKRQSEQIVQDASTPWTILRPSVVYQDLQSGVLGTIARYLRLPYVPVIGSGTAIYQPLTAEDLSRVVVAAIEKPIARGRIYDIGGPSPVNFLEMVTQTAEVLGRTPRFVHIPPFVAKTLAQVGEWIGRGPVTKSNVLGALQSTTMNIEPMQRDFSFTPRSFRDGLALAALGVSKAVQRPSQVQESRT